jgi:hypothetical protein
MLREETETLDRDERRKAKVEESMKVAMEPPPVPAGEEIQRLRMKANTPEITRRKKEDVDELDEKMKKKDKEFRKAFVEPPPSHYEKKLSDVQEIRREEAKRRATEKAEAIQRVLAEGRIEKAKRAEQRKAEGKARQAKAEGRTKKGKK